MAWQTPSTLSASTCAGQSAGQGAGIGGRRVTAGPGQLQRSSWILLPPAGQHDAPPAGPCTLHTPKASAPGAGLRAPAPAAAPPPPGSHAPAAAARPPARPPRRHAGAPPRRPAGRPGPPTAASRCRTCAWCGGGRQGGESVAGQQEERVGCRFSGRCPGSAAGRTVRDDARPAPPRQPAAPPASAAPHHSSLSASSARNSPRPTTRHATPPRARSWASSPAHLQGQRGRHSSA